MRNRFLLPILKAKQSQKHGRLIALTGARQTGKTTLCKELGQGFEYINFDDPILRREYLKFTSNDWLSRERNFIFDEVQKAPQFFDTIKAIYDKTSTIKIMLTGSAQLLLMKQMKESLAGRCTIYELLPLTLPEQGTLGWNTPIQPSFFQIFTQERDFGLLNHQPLFSENYASKKQNFQNYLQFGAMPELTDKQLTADEKYEWLYQYNLTYLQKDLQDIANINDLSTFVDVQNFLAINAGELLNFSTIAKNAKVSPTTAQRFISFLEMSYIIFLLPPWFKNLNKRLSKSPKAHFIDPGVQRAILRRKGTLTSHEYESAVVAEIYKQNKYLKNYATLHHLRTVDGREIDLVLEYEDGFILIEIKQTQKVGTQDCRHLKNVADIFDKPIIASFVLSEQDRIEELDSKTYAVPTAWFLG